jgi:putative aldouronate transport system permease protein
LIPFYMTVKTLGLINSIWALVLPGAIPVFNVLLLMNFFRQLPQEIEESVFLDGAGHWTNLWRIQVPLSMPAIATLILFTTVGHWNSWFDGLILMNHPKNYPLQSYLQTIVTTIEQRLTNMTAEDVKILSEINDRTTKSAQIFLAALPILSVYPFLQRYFMSGIVLGSVKG